MNARQAVPGGAADAADAADAAPAGGIAMRRTVTALADGRELIYYDRAPVDRTAIRDPRLLPDPPPASELRYDALLDEWVAVAAHRQERTFLPPADECPLCPSVDGRTSEIPAADYDVVVFENRFPAFSDRVAPAVADGARPTGRPATSATSGAPGVPGAPAPPGTPTAPGTSGTSAGIGEESGVPGESEERAGAAGDPEPPVATRPGYGRCEVVCFTSDHDVSFAGFDPERVRLIMEVWADRTAELSARPGVRQVYCFENRGVEIGVTLHHPHGQIYAYPFVTPRTRRMLDAARRHRERTGGDLFADVLAAERRAGARIVAENPHWVAFVPMAARWPFEVHLYPLRRVRTIPELDPAERDAFGPLYLDVLRRLDGLFGVPMPYVSGWYQAPVPAAAADTAHDGAPGRTADRDLAYLHLRLFSIRRAPGKLKYLAGSESGMGAFLNDVRPEEAARMLREATPVRPRATASPPASGRGA